MKEVLHTIDPRVVQITAEHVKDADRLLGMVWGELPDGTGMTEEELEEHNDIAIALGMGAVSLNGEIFHAPFLFPHALVGQELYLHKLSVRTVEDAIDIIAQAEDQQNIGWGVYIDPNDVLFEDNSEAGIGYTSVGLWRRETEIPDVVKSKLGVIGYE